MKKFLAIMLAVLMLLPLCVFNVAGAEESKCTYKRTNVAATATITHNSSFWGVDPQFLVDGKYDQGTAAGSDIRTTVYTFQFASPLLFDEVVMVVNSKGDLPASYQGQFKQEASNNDYPITLKMYNGDNEVYTYGPVTTLDCTKISTADDGDYVPVTATKIVISIDNDNANHLAALWEVEAYSGATGKHDWQEGTRVDSTCETAGYIPLSCACGAASKITLPLSEEHSWDNGTEKTPATESTDGVKEYKCTVCEKTIEVKIPATAHNAFDEGVVTAPTCTEMGYTTYTCTHCSTYTYKDNYVNALGHDMDDGEMSIKPTFTTKGEMTYSCKRTECDYHYEEVLPEAWYRDSEFVIGADHATITEQITGTPFAQSNPASVMDGIIMIDPWKADGDNCWKAPAGTDCAGALTIEFDYEYYLTGAKFYIYGNSLGFTIEIFDGENNSIYRTEKSNYAVSSAIAEPIVVEVEIMGKLAKKVVITSTNQHGKSPWVSEVAISAHKCLYDDADKTNVVTEAEICKTTFNGTCWMCKQARTSVVEYNHTFEKETGTEVDKIYTTNADETTNYKDATCYADGKGYKHCTVCDVNVDTVILATGNHDFENGAPVYDDDKAPTCGEGATGYITCATEGCVEKMMDQTFPATGAHSKWNWKVIEGEEPDYTHTGLKGYFCGVCGYQDTSKENQVADKSKLNAVSQKDWSVRYTDFVSPRATFKLSKNNIEAIEDEFDVKIFGVVQKGEATKEIQVYGEGATGKVGSDGTFSLVVKGASYTDEYKFSVRVEITCKADNTKAENTVTSKNITTAPDGTVSAKDVATYLIAPNRVDELDAELKKFFEKIAE